MRKLFTSGLFFTFFIFNSYSVFGQTYCIPTYSNLCASLDFINNFSFNTIVRNNSGCSGNTNNYAFYSNTTTVMRGSTYNVSMQAGSAYSQSFGVWIDFNKDGDFADASEFVYASPNASTSVFSGVITIPQSASLGSTRLRVRCKYSGTVSSTESCALFSYGETEDYQITINAGNPNISYAVSGGNICVGSTVTFTNSTTDVNAYQYHWFFGDGTSFIQNYSTTVVHTYSTAALYNSYVQVYNNTFGYLGGDTKQINVQAGTNGWFNISKDSACPGEMISFDPNYNTVFSKWHMSDGYTSTNYYINRSFPTVGNYTVNCIINTPCGPDTISRIFKVRNSIFPDANFSFNPGPSVCPNKKIDFNPSELSGTHVWNFGDGQTSSIPAPYHSYTAVATYSVTHTLTNLCGNQSVQTYTISIDNSTFPITANFGYNPSVPVCPGIQIGFGSYNYDGPQWLWDFGDGNSAMGPYPKHTYVSAGNYTVTHTVINECNNTLAQTYTLQISDTLSPTSIFSVGPNPVCPNELVNFYPSEQAGKTYQWNFGDGSSSSLKSPSHSYTATGTYSVTLTVKNFCNIQKSYTDVVNVNGNLPVNVSAIISLYPQPACPTQPVDFYVGASGFPLYVWNYGDGTQDSSSSNYIQHSYTVAGTYSASVTIVNFCGNDTVLYKVVNVANAISFPTSPLNVSPLILCPGQNVYASGPSGYPSYEWNMGNGSALFTTINNAVAYSYTATGSYPIALTVTDFCGRDSIYRDTVSVINATTFCTGGGCIVNISSSAPACPNQSVSFAADNGYALYKWNFGDGSSVTTSTNQTTHNYTIAGNYNYTLTITNFCGIDTVLYASLLIDNTMPVPSWLSFYATPDVVCAGQEVQFSTDYSFYTYFWNFDDGSSANGSANVTHTYTANALYTPSVTITNTCGNSTTLVTSVLVDANASFPNWINLTSTPDPSCPNSSVVLETTSGYVSYKWIFGDGDTIITSTSKVPHSYSSVGSFNASVLVMNSCGNSVTLYKTIGISSIIPISCLDINLPNNPACPTDIAMLNPYLCGSQSAGVIFSWNYGDGSPLDTTIGIGSSHAYATVGVYNIVLTATNACGKSLTNSKLITINGNASPQLSPSNFGVLTESFQAINSVCPGDVVVFYFEGINQNNVWYFGDGSTGIATDIFVRSDGVTITTIKHAYSTLGTKNYTLTLGNSCTNSASLIKPINVSNNMLISGGFNIEPPSSSLGYTTCGLIDFVAFGGKNFVWDFGDGSTLSTTSPSVGHAYLTSGNYAVKVKITNGCGNSATYTKTLIVNGVGGTTVNSTIVTPTCFGSTNGSASTTVSGGQAPYTYTWYNSIGQQISSNVSVNNLSAGNYLVTVTDNNGCLGSAPVVLNNPAAITFTTASTKANCGGTNGTATAFSIAGGTTPYTYAWTNGQTTSVATGLSFGNYAVTVTAANGCSTNKNISISENGATVALSSVANLTCNGGNTGSASISVTGGTTPYSYSWSNGKTTQNITGLIAGNYSVVVTDNGGCRSTINAAVVQPTAVVVNATPLVSPTCGNFDGSAIANATGGNPPYTYLWPGAANQTTQSATGLPAGTYTVQIRDANSCLKNGVVTLSNANAPVVTSVATNVNCTGGGNGSVDITVTGGTSPYLYTWNVGAPQTNNQDITGLVPGNYVVIINDAAGCISVRSYVITQPSALTSSVTSTSATCGTNNGTATATASGGTAPFSYLWMGGQTTQTATGLALGTRTVAITDSNGCTTSSTTTVTATTTPVNICAISVDNTSTKNLIAWVKPVVGNIDSFRIYRNIATVYTYVGAKSYADSSYFVDNTNGVNPNTTSYKYKIKVLDTCGNESALSDFHQTIHLQVSVAISPNSFNLSWNDYFGFPVTQYRIMVDSLSNGNWKARDSVPFGTLTWTDSYTYPDTVSYMIEVAHPNGCAISMKYPDPMASNLNLSKSNINRIADTSLNPHVRNINAEMMVSLYPNPSSGIFTIEVKDQSKGPVLVKVFNMLAAEVSQTNYTVNKNRIAMDLSKQPKGVYYIQISSADKMTTKKVVID